MKDVITIDGPSGAGKSTVSKLLAEKLGYKYLDTGALYRAVAWKIKEDRINPEDEKQLAIALEKISITLEGNKIMVNGIDIRFKIRSQEIGELSSKLSAIPIVRKCLFAIQREIGLKGKTVIEGRDIGTVIFPEAKNKFFLDASLEERGNRRYKELKHRTQNTPASLPARRTAGGREAGRAEHRTQIKDREKHKALKNKKSKITLKATIEAIKQRDKRDSTRQSSPLRRTKDMAYIDTTSLTVKEVVAKIMEALDSP